MLKLDTPRKKAFAAAGGLAGLLLFWTGGRMILILPFFYPYLIGHLPWPILLCAWGAVGVLGWYAWKFRARHVAVKAAGAYLIVFASLLLFGRSCQSSKLRWLAWHHDGAGLRAGLLRVEVDETLSRRAKLDAPCVPGGCTYKPRGLAGFAFTVMGAYGVDTEYGPDGKLVSWKTWSD